MTSEPPLLLDVSRLISRLGGGVATGIDRVEAAWLRHLQTRPHLLLCRVPRGQLVLPPEAGAAILRWTQGDVADLPRAGLRDRLRRTPTLRARAERALSGHALHRAGPDGRGVARAATDRLGPGAAYLNTGHANWDRGLFAALQPLRRAVLVHDTIPLDHPEYTRPGQDRLFRDRFAAVAEMADVIATVSQASADSVALWRERLGTLRRQPVIAAPIGTELAAPTAADVPAGLTGRPFFVTLGTIEPRKNHALLLDVWQHLAARHGPAQVPGLLIVGRRGWENRQTFARLDALPPGAPVAELGGLDDGAVAALLMQARALLMPSRAEGFGLPLTEAAGRGIPIICAALPSATRLLGDYATYLDPDDTDGWAAQVMALAGAPLRRFPPLPVPGWPDHFRNVMAGLKQASD